MGLAESIAQTYLEAGRQRADLLRQQGQITGGLISSLGQIPGQIFGQIRQQKEQDLQAQQQKTAEQLKQQQLQEGQLRLAQGQREAAGQQKLSDILQQGHEGPDFVGPTQSPLLTEDNLYDIPKVTAALNKSGFGDMAPNLLKTAESLNESITKHREQTAKLVQSNAILIGDLAHGARQLVQAGMPIDQALDMVALPTISGPNPQFDPKQYAQLKQQMVQLPPEQQDKALSALMDRAAQLGGGETLAEGATRYDRYGRPVAVGGSKPKTEAELDAAYQDAVAVPPERRTPAQQSTITGYEARKTLAKPPKDSAAEMDARYQALAQKQTLKQPLTPAEQAEMTAYERRKLLGPEAASAAANDRQSRTIAAQVAQQGRAQDFTEQQAGRKEYTDKIATPYQTALASAQTMRDTVAAAQGGNKVAANLQNLETAMAAIRAQGLNRINTTEIGVAANAGSLWDRIQGRIGALVAGKPVPADLQKDMLAFADILEKSATMKYQKGRNSLQQTYKGLTLPDESAPAAAPAAAGGSISVKAPNGRTYTFQSQADADAFKAKAGIR